MGVGMCRARVLVEEAVGGQYIAEGFVVGRLTATTEDGLNGTAPVCTPVLVNCPERTEVVVGGDVCPIIPVMEVESRDQHRISQYPGSGGPCT
jgi:hypothetical protein